MKMAKWGLGLRFGLKWQNSLFTLVSSVQVLWFCFTWLDACHCKGEKRSLLTESFGLLDGKEQLFFQLFKAFVRWQIQSVKTARQDAEWDKRALDFVFCVFICDTHQVWLLGSHVSLPTFSMQNFWGPLLPAGQSSYVYYLNSCLKLLKCHYFLNSITMTHFISNPSLLVFIMRVCLSFCMLP